MSPSLVPAELPLPAAASGWQQFCRAAPLQKPGGLHLHVASSFSNALKAAVAWEVGSHPPLGSAGAERGSWDLAGHGLSGATGQRRAGRPRGAKAIVLDWRILTQMAREKQIGGEMNKLYR